MTHHIRQSMKTRLKTSTKIDGNNNDNNNDTYNNNDDDNNGDCEVDQALIFM